MENIFLLKLLPWCNDLCKYWKCCFQKKLFSRWKRQFLERHERKTQFYWPRARIRYAIICGKSESIRKFPGLHTPRFNDILTSDFPCHGLSTNWNEYSSWHSVDTSHVLEQGTSGYVRILEEYGSVSCDFSFAIRLISHSVSNSHTLLPKRSIYEKLKVTFGTPV